MKNIDKFSLRALWVPILLFLLCIGYNVPKAYSNALNITGLSVNQTNKTVTFSVQWQNSWRVTTSPSNWDGVWIFVKFRNCGTPPTTAWSHGAMSVNLGDHNFGSDLEPTFSDGSSVGIDASPNNTGVMLRRNSVGIFASPAATTITLNVTNLPGAGTDIDVKVFGIEMVFVPGSAFWAGDNASWGGLSSISNANVAFQVSSENAVTVHADNSWNDAQVDNVNLPAAYPKGFNPFYCMKYEISQHQYSEFLNTISSTIQNVRYLGNFNSYRNRSSNTGTPPNLYVSDRPNRAQNYLTWADFSAYLDWAALKPMSELQFEKACRGLGPVVSGEFAWGTTNIYQGTVISTTIPSENGTEVFLNTPTSNCNYYYDAFTGGGDGGYGPVRVGMNALPTSSTREAAGASFYGIQDLTGNVGEYCVAASGQSLGYLGSWGDGNIDNATGVHTQGDWPAGTLTSGYQVAIRGGAWDSDGTRIRMDDRYEYYSGRVNSYFYTRGNCSSYGGRGIR
ncbi:MAG: hypothetical protein LC115_00005 [Bacteroidia bacterium]|nr:hypothetical protein [Bacteroidia bacterium]